MADFRVQTTWRIHPKRMVLKDLAGADGVLAIEDMWSVATELFPETGEFRGMTAAQICKLIGYEKDPDTLFGALVSIRLVDRKCDSHNNITYQLHNWILRQPWVVDAKRRSASARHAANKKWRQLSKNKEDHAPRICPSPFLSSPILLKETAAVLPEPAKQAADLCLDLLDRYKANPDPINKLLGCMKSGKKPLTPGQRRSLLISLSTFDIGLIEVAIQKYYSNGHAGKGPSYFLAILSGLNQEASAEPPKRIPRKDVSIYESR